MSDQQLVWAANLTETVETLAATVRDLLETVQSVRARHDAELAELRDEVLELAKRIPPLRVVGS